MLPLWGTYGFGWSGLVGIVVLLHDGCALSRPPVVVFKRGVGAREVRLSPC